jgi:integrase
MAAGIDTRHARSCRSRDGERCNCEPTYQAHVWSNRERKRIRKTFSSLAAAKAWRQDAQVALREGRIQAPAKTTLGEAATQWLEGARKGAIHNRSGDRYKSSVVRGYGRALNLRLLPQFGSRRLSDVHRSELQRFVEQLVGEGLAASTIHNALMPLRAIFRREVAQGRLAVNPTSGLQLPAVRGTRDRIADPEEASALILALPIEDRAVWATALYAGLRRGELMALQWSDVDLAAGVIRVERAWDEGGVVEPKSAKGRRKVPIAGVLRDQLVEHRMRQGRSDGLVFGKTGRTPFYPHGLSERADTAWEAVGLERITLHEARHTFASLMIAAGVNAKALSTYMGHANISITLDRYGHLMPGNEDEAAGMLDAYLERANSQARAAQLA